MGIRITGALLVRGALAVTFLLPTVAWANERLFNLREQAATKSIPEFARQAKIQIVASGRKLRGIRTPAVHGQYEVRTALAMLLKGTGLRIVADNEDIITLAGPPPASPFRRAPQGRGEPRASAAATSERGGRRVLAPIEPAQMDIVVTALHRPMDIQETPLAISAVGPRVLDNLGITSSQDLARVAPNLIVRQNVNGGGRVVLRNIHSAGEPTVGLYFDETALTGSTGVNNDAGGSTPEVRLFDVERVEVLRGPQGTLYGAGSMAGTVRLIFAKPDLHRYEGEMMGQAAAVAHGDWGHSVQGMMNVPIVEGRLGARAVAFEEDFGGWIDNSRLGLRNFNNRKTYGGRLLLRYQPIDALTVDGLAVYQERHGFSSFWNYQAFRDEGRKYDQDVDTATQQEDTLQLYSATLKWRMPFATLTAVSAYSERGLTSRFNLSLLLQRDVHKSPSAPGCLRYFDIPSGTAAMCDAAQLASYRDYIEGMQPLTTFQPQTTRTWSQEVRIANDDSRFKWTFGFYHSRRRSTVRSILGTANPMTGRLDPGFRISLDRRVDDVLEQHAGFAEATWEVTPDFSIAGGVRYFEYRKRTDSEVAVGNAAFGTVASPPSSNHATERGSIFNFNSKYALGSDAMIYASATQGFRPGGVNQIVGLSADLASYASSYRSDGLWNYELGLKAAWQDRAFVLNADIFQIDWDNIQVGAATGDDVFMFVTNAGKVRVRGAELEATARPTAGLTLHIAGSYSSATLRGDQVAPPGIVIQGAGRDGDHVPYTPNWTGQASAEYLKPISDRFDMLLHADIAYLGSSWTQFTRDPASRLLHRLPPMTIVGIRAGVQSHDERWGIYLNIDNLLDKVGIMSTVNVGSQDPQRLYAVGTRPRTIGLTIRSRY